VNPRRNLSRHFPLLEEKMSRHPFLEKVEQNRRNGMDRAAAFRAAREADPEGCQSWVDEHNARYGDNNRDVNNENFRRRGGI
jgi:hypothetical protein